MINNKTREALLAWLELLRTSNFIKKTIDAKLRSEFGQSISRFDVLSTLERGGRNGVRAGDLSRTMVVSEGNVTQLMSKLLRDNLVLKRNDKNDARVVIYSLSDEGSQLFKKMAIAHAGWISDIFKQYSIDNLAELRELLDYLPSKSKLEEVA